MLKWLKEIIKRLPGIRYVVEGRDRFIQLYNEQLEANGRLSAEIENLQQLYNTAMTNLEQSETERKRESLLYRENSRALEAKLAAESTAREEERKTLTEQLAAESTAREEERKVLTEQLAAESTAREEERKVLTEQLAAEREARAEERNALEAQLHTEKETYKKECEYYREELEKKTAELQQLDYRRNTEKLSSADFWNEIYLTDGNSGSGSYQRLAEFKARIVNAFLKKNNIDSVIELGCGDGNVLSMIDYRSYTGVDVSPVIIEKNRDAFADRDGYSFYCSLTEREKYTDRRYDMALSMDVIFHLLEDDVFHAYMNDLFTLAKRYVVIYSSNHEEYTRWPEYRHRNFTGYVSKNFPEWELIRYIPNEFPYQIGNEENTSASDFYIFAKK